MANRRDIDVNLSFTADTQKAKTQLQELQETLTKITQGAGNNRPLGITSDLTQAISKATQLQAALQKATTSTGKLDLSQFKHELDKANLSADELATTLSQFGTAGQQAFMSLAKSVSAAEMPIKRTNRLVQEFATTMRNTAKWMLSSGILHGFMSSVQRAVGYVEDLNTSLNHIRIVTGQNTDQMAKFAKEANAAAKSLSATTTAYTDASLIFYQQGLTGEAVKERTDAVIKLSNITGESVEDVSSYMTAIWNNFADGSTSLEHFADVITALGATTASSSAEIAQGLEKFAAIGQTVGLSYDYATSALATVVAKTRLSADTVGNAFKTIFARLQSLKLGETLEDNVDLTKYTAALDAVGVQVLDVSGNLRDLDGVLDDLADKWNLMTEAERAALAQTVAGTRQYSQFIALMDNWSDVQNNLLTARNAEGTLQAQADIYAESWEAARKRVQAAAQGIYQSILDDNFFINLNNGFATVLKSLKDVVSSFGGLKGLLPGISALLLNMFGNELNNGIQNAIYNIQKFTKSGQEALVQTKMSFNNALAGFDDDSTPTGAIMSEVYTKQGVAQNEIIEKNKLIISQGLKLNEAEQAQLKLLADIVEKKGEEYIKSAENLTKLQEEEEVLRKIILDEADNPRAYVSSVGADPEAAQKTRDDLNYLDELQKQYTALINLRRKFAEQSDIFGDEKAKEGLKNILKQLEEIHPSADVSTKAIERFKKALGDLAETQGKITPEAFNKAIKESGQLSSEVADVLNVLRGRFSELSVEGQRAHQAIDEIEVKFKEIGEAEADLTIKSNNFSQSWNTQIEAIRNGKGELPGYVEQLTSFASALAAVGMAINSIKSIGNIWSNKDATTGEKLVSTFTTLGFLIPSLVRVWTQLRRTILITNVSQNEAVKLNLKDALALVVHKKAVDAETSAEIKKATAMAAANTVMLASMAIIGAIVAVIGIVTAAMNAYSKKIKENAERAKENADAHKELTDAYVEEKDNLNSLAEEYNKLYTDASLGAEELEVKVVELMRQHENQRGVVQALNRDYEALNKTIKQAQIEQNKIVANAAREDVNNYKNVVAGNLRDYAEEDGRRLDHNGDTIDLKDAYSRNTREDNLEKALTNLLGEGLFKNDDHIYVDKFAEGAVKNYDELRKILNEFNDVAYARQLSQYLSKLDEDVKLYNESTERLKDAKFDEVFLGNFNADTFDFTQYSDIVSKVGEGLREESIEITDDQVRDLVTKEISAYDELADYVKSLDLAWYVVDNSDIDQSVEEVADKIQDFNESERSIIYIHPRVAAEEFAKGINYSKEKLMEEFGAEVDYFTAKNKVDSLSNVALDFMNKGKFSDADRQAALAAGIENANYATEGELIQQILTSRDQYGQSMNEVAREAKKTAEKRRDEDSKAWEKAVASEGYWKHQNEIAIDEDLKTNLIEEYKALHQGDEEGLKELESLLSEGWFEEYSNNIEKFKSHISFNAHQNENWTGYDDSGQMAWMTQFEKLFATDGNNLTNNGGEILAEFLNSKNFKNSSKRIEETTQKVQEATEEVNKAKTVLDSSSAAVDKIQRYTVNYAETLQLLSEYAEIVNNKINTLQSTFKAVDAAQQEYAETGTYSIDTIQSLLDLGPEQLQYMHLEGDAVLTNTELLKQKTLAYYDELEATYSAQAATEIATIATKESAEEDYQKILSTYAKVTAEKLLTGTLDEQIGKLKALKVAGEEAADGMLAYYQNIQKIINLGRKNIDNAFTSSTSGKSAKASQKEYKEYLEELPDRYHDINNAIKEVTHSLEVLQKFQDKLAGKALIDSLTKQNKLIEKQQQNYKKLAGMLKSEQQQLQGQDKLGQFGAQFDTSGRVTNYADTYSKIEAGMISATNAYNAKIAEYNKMSKADQEAKGDAMLKRAEDEYENAKKLHDDAQDWLSRADEIIDEFNDAEEKYIEAQQKKVENNLKKFTERFKIKIDINDAKKQIVSFFREVGEDFTKTFKSSTDMQSEIDSYRKEGKLSAKNVKTLGNEFNDVSAILDNDNYNYGADDLMFMNKAEGIQYAQEVFNQMMEEGKALYESYKSAYEAFLSNISSVNEEWDKITDNIHDTIEELDHYQKLTELLYGDTDKGRQLLQQYYETSAQAQLMEQKTLTAKIDAYKNIYSQMEAQGAAADSKELEEVRNIINESEKNLRSSIESYLQTIQSEFTNSIKTIIDTMDKSMVGMFGGPAGMGLLQISERWQDAQDAADGYYDEVQRIYQLEQLENKWNKALKDTKSIKNQQLMKSIMDAQLKNLEEKTELSEYDIALAEKQLEVTKAQMALDEARNNKNTMKLVRNEQGSWAYQYVADEDEIVDKEQKALDLLYDQYDFIKQSVADGTEELLQLQQTAQEKLSAIMEEYMHADEARQAELQKQYDYFYNYYYGNNGLIVKKSKESANKQKDLEIAGMETLWGLYTQNDKNYEKMTDKQIELIKEVNETGCASYLDLAKKVAIDGNSYYNQIANTAKSVIGETQTEWEKLANNITAKWGTNPQSVRNIVVQAHADAQDAFDKYKQDIATSEAIIKKSWSDIGTEIKGVKDQLDSKSDGLNKHLQDMINKTKDLGVQRQKVDELRISWEKQKKALKEAGDKLEKYVNLLNKKDTYTISVVFDVGKLDLPNPAPIHVKVQYDDPGYQSSGSTKKIPEKTTPEKTSADLKFYVTDKGGIKISQSALSQTEAVDLLSKDPNNRLIIETSQWDQTYKGKWAVVTAKDGRFYSGPYSSQRDAENNVRNNAKSMDVRAYATGGYTGEWGSEGKLAMLHEKELVLNKTDTANILDAVAAVREISGLGSSIANSISTGITNLVASMIGIKPSVAATSQTITNNGGTNTFNIHAEFPNANSVAEIQEAILSLPNLASQYLSQNNI